MKPEQTECSETSAYKIQTPGNYPEENIQEHTNCFTVGMLPTLNGSSRTFSWERKALLWNFECVL